MSEDAPAAVETAPAPKKRRFQVKGRFLWISIGLHVALFLFAGYLVVSTIITKPKKEFKAGPKGPNPNSRVLEHKIQMTKVKNTMSAPPQSKRIVTTGVSKISLPDLPTVGESNDFTVNSMAGMGVGEGALSMGGGGAGGGGPAINFFGLKARSNAVIFIVDVSGSMITGNNKSAETWLKLEDAVRKALEGLTPSTKFNVILFSKGDTAFRSEMVSATRENVKAALDFIKRESPVAVLRSGEKPTAATWTKGRGLQHRGTKPSAAFRRAFAAKPDAIIFVSDGEPDRDDPAPNVLSLVQQRQSALPKKVKISALAYFADGGQAFMKQLASANGGEFKEIR